MEKVHILLVENCDDEIDFFSDAFEQSGLQFFCSVARNLHQAVSIFKNTLPDAIFINVNIMQQEYFGLIKKIKALQNTPVIFYSTVLTPKMQASFQKLNYVQLPGNTCTMARVLKNLFIENAVHNEGVDNY